MGNCAGAHSKRPEAAAREERQRVLRLALFTARQDLGERYLDAVADASGAERGSDGCVRFWSRAQRCAVEVVPRERWLDGPLDAVVFLAPAVEYEGREGLLTAVSAFRALAEKAALGGGGAALALILDRTGAGQVSPRGLAALCGGDGEARSAADAADAVAALFLQQVTAVAPPARTAHFFVSVDERRHCMAAVGELLRVAAMPGRPAGSGRAGGVAGIPARRRGKAALA